MKRKKKIRTLICLWTGVVGAASVFLRKKADKDVFSADSLSAVEPRHKGLYESYTKRVLDVICAGAAITFLSPLYLVIAVLVRVKLGSPVIFVQERPGMVDANGKETIFKMYKFRTMTEERDEEGVFLPDGMRTSGFGEKLRASSLDELPEVINILNGTMSVTGPRPQLVEDMLFMSDKQRKRHTAKPGLTGLAQIKGRNAITWEEKLNWDLEYIKSVNFFRDLKIVLETAAVVFKKDGITDGENATALNYGDVLLQEGKVTGEEYIRLKKEADAILENRREAAWK